MTNLLPLVRELEARLEADVESKDGRRIASQARGSRASEPRAAAPN
jgi:hypothetical protein